MSSLRGSGIITRGFNHTTIITRGYASIFRKIVEVIQQIPQWGRSGYREARDRVSEIIIYVKLVMINDNPPRHNVEGRVVVDTKTTSNVSTSLVEHITTRIKRAWSDIIISITRTRRK